MNSKLLFGRARKKPRGAILTHITRLYAGLRAQASRFFALGAAGRENFAPRVASPLKKAYNVKVKESSINVRAPEIGL
ncbi:MAG: hypothetical protein MR821_05300 [Clostridiales bacterium]|nr:hypothetical protein [Clostridiales bacterium]